MAIVATYYDPTRMFFNLYQASGLTGLSFAVVNQEPSRIDFAPGTSSANQTMITNAAEVFDWVPLPAPEPSAFIAALKSDTNIQPIYFLLAPYEYAISTYNDINAPAIKAIWAQLISQYGSTLLTSELQTLIDNYAQSCNMPFT